MAFDVLDPSDLIGHIPAGADLSTKQFYFVQEATNGKLFAALTAGARVLGVLQNKPDAAGKDALVANRGISKLKLASAANPGDLLISTTAGEAITTGATGSHYVAKHMGLAAGAAGDVVPALIGYFGAT